MIHSQGNPEPYPFNPSSPILRRAAKQGGGNAITGLTSPATTPAAGHGAAAAPGEGPARKFGYLSTARRTGKALVTPHNRVDPPTCPGTVDWRKFARRATKMPTGVRKGTSCPWGRRATQRPQRRNPGASAIVTTGCAMPRQPRHWPPLSWQQTRHPPAGTEGPSVAPVHEFGHVPRDCRITRQQECGRTRRVNDRVPFLHGHAGEGATGRQGSLRPHGNPPAAPPSHRLCQ